MKHVFLFTLTLSLLAGCSSAPTTQEDGTAQVQPAPEVQEDVQVEEDTQEEENSQEETPDNESQEEETFKVPAESEVYAEAIRSARSEEANQYNPIFVSEEDELTQYIFPILNFDPSKAEAYAISISAMNAQAYGIVAILPVEGEEQGILEGVTGFMDLQVQNFTGYLPDQLAIAQAARLETLEDGTILMVMSEDQDQILEDILAELGTPLA